MEKISMFYFILINETLKNYINKYPEKINAEILKQCTRLTALPNRNNYDSILELKKTASNNLINLPQTAIKEKKKLEYQIKSYTKELYLIDLFHINDETQLYKDETNKTLNYNFVTSLKTLKERIIDRKLSSIKTLINFAKISVKESNGQIYAQINIELNKTNLKDFQFIQMHTVLFGLFFSHMRKQIKNQKDIKYLIYGGNKERKESEIAEERETQGEYIHRLTNRFNGRIESIMKIFIGKYNFNKTIHLYYNLIEKISSEPTDNDQKIVMYRYDNLIKGVAVLIKREAMIKKE